jgi:hypothetical protein
MLARSVGVRPMPTPQAIRIFAANQGISAVRL